MAIAMNRHGVKSNPARLAKSSDRFKR